MTAVQLSSAQRGDNKFRMIEEAQAPCQAEPADKGLLGGPRQT